MSSDKDALLAQLKIDRKKTPQKKKRPTGLLLIGGIMALGALWLSGLLTGPASDREPVQAASATSVETAPMPDSPAAPSATASAPAPRPQRSVAARGEAVLNASGYVVARRIATVSAQLTGLITEVMVEEGLRVEEGQVLARLDDAVARVNLDLARSEIAVRRAAIAQTGANLAEAKRVLVRTTKLKDQDFSSEAALTRAQADVEVITAQLSQQKANLVAAEQAASLQAETLDDHIIRAPFTGVVIDKSAQPGEMISPISAGGGFTRTGICTIVDMESLEIEVDVNEAFIARVKSDQRVRANLDAYPDWNIAAHVIAIVPTANRDKATVRVRIGIDALDPRILPDMGIKVAFLAD